MNRVQAGVLVLLVLLAAGPVATAATGGGTASTGGSAGAAVEADLLEFRITVFENGSARWTFTYTRMLENDTERDRFTAYAEEFETNETDAYRTFRDQARGLAASGRNATGRDMQARNFSRSAHLGGNCVTTQDCGTVSMSFVWTEFAAPAGEDLVVGDVFGTGLYLSPDQKLVFEAGPELSFSSANPGSYTPRGTTLANSDSITYEGEQSFSDGRPRAAFAPDQGATTQGTADPGTSPTGDGATSTNDDQGGTLPVALIGGLLVLFVATGAAFVWWRGEGGAIHVGGGGPEDGGTAAERNADVDSEPAVPEEELLTDEDRVLNLLEENGGRMKQVDIVEETGWSKSKVSMLLSDMEEDQQISKLRVGRENIISLAGHEPEAAGSPHDED